MKILLLTTALFSSTLAGSFAVLAPTVPPLGPAEYEVDGTHSSVIFRVHHVGAAYFYGRFNKVSGGMTFDPDAPAGIEIDLTIDAASVDTASANRDKHLRSPDFFDAKQFPVITFTATDCEKTADGYQVTGELQLRGVTKPLTATFVHTGSGEFRGSQREGFESTFTIQRSDFGVSYGVEQGVLGDAVRVTIALEMIKG